ncbi:MAG: hypothetical protein HLUCCA12_09560 [Rhodobacteraceae bacterium HLUCCA12]|nr:MAG: hypothetical protein HLUCCA12_09560 [Rhodobacteraceae bacterium HLUCCA12]
MPNVKFYIDARTCPASREAIAGMLPDLRALICETLEVPPEACQFALIEVAGMDDQPQINTELQLLPSPTRTPDHLRGVAHRLRETLEQSTGVSVAVRMATLDPQTYVALK